MRTYKRKPDAKRYANYTQQNLQNAVAEHRSIGTPYRLLQEKYGVDKMKILRAVKGLHTKKHGGQNVLTELEEATLVNNLKIAAEWGFPFTKLDLKLIVKGYLNRNGVRKKIFKENTPGDDWIKSFLDQNKSSITVRISQNIKHARAEVSSDVIARYFSNLEKSLDGVAPERIVNYDETNLTDDPGSVKVLVKRGCRHPDRIIASSKQSTSIMVAASASGKLLPPYIVYKAKNLYDTWTTGGPKGTRYKCTKSGWFDQITFEDWFDSIALPYFKTLGAGEKSVLIGDNLSSHISAHVIEECQNNNIKFILLPKNATHLCQPLDVAFFRPFKVNWRKLLNDWKRFNKCCVPKNQFPSLLKKLFDIMEATSEQTIKSGFLKTGIYPVDQEKVLSQLPQVLSNDTADSVTSTFITHLKNLRHNPNPIEKQRKRKTRQVEAGKSLCNMESTDEEPSDGELPEIEVEDRSDIEEEMADNHSVQNDTDSTDPIEVDDYVLVQLENINTKKKKVFVGKVTKENKMDFVVVFLKAVADSTSKFTWPTVEDASIVLPQEIIRKLPEPEILRRGHLQFDERVLANV